MSLPVGDAGVPEYDHLVKLADDYGIVDPRLEIQCPYEMIGYWQIYCDLSKTRTSDHPITYSEILAYSELHGQRLSALTIRVIKDLDMLWLETQDKHRRERK